jgi:hypothetical protein
MKLNTSLKSTVVALSLGLTMNAAAQEQTVPVTIDNFNQAIFVKFAKNWTARGADQAIVHLPILAPAGDKAPVVRMNQDSVYSSAVVKADKDGMIRVTIDEFENETGTKDLYTSVHVLDENSAAPLYKVGPGEYEVKIDTEWAFVIFRAGGVADKTDLTDPLAAQSRFHVDYSSTDEPYNPVHYDRKQLDEVEAKLKQEFLVSGEDFFYVKSSDSPDADNYLQAMSNAQGWGGMPVEEGVSNIYRNTQQFDGSQCQQTTFEEPDNKYFTSITLYDDRGYMLETDRFSINSYEWDKNEDGTVTISFNCGKDALNNLETNDMDFNYTVRNYGVSSKVAYDYYGGRDLQFLAGGKPNPNYNKK